MCECTCILRDALRALGTRRSDATQSKNFGGAASEVSLFVPFVCLSLNRERADFVSVSRFAVGPASQVSILFSNTQKHSKFFFLGSPPAWKLLWQHVCVKLGADVKRCNSTDTAARKDGTDGRGRTGRKARDSERTLTVRVAADHWLPTQVSAAEIERVFSLCGHVLTARRNRLHQDKVNLLITACYGLRQAALDKATEGLHQDMYQAMLEALGQVDVSAEEEM